MWCGPAASALIRPLPWEPPCATGEALKRQKKKKNDTNELIRRIETDSQTLKNLCYQRGQVEGGRDGVGVWKQHMHTTVYGTTGQRGPAI